MNYERYFSVMLSAVIDISFFQYADIVSFGKDSDFTIFINSSIWKNIQNNTLMILQPTTVPSGVAGPPPLKKKNLDGAAFFFIKSI